MVLDNFHDGYSTERPKKLTGKSEAVKLLRSMFDEGKIDSKTDPSTVYQFYAEFFTNHRLDLFHTCLNTLKCEYRDLQGVCMMFKAFQQFLLTILI